MLSDILCNVKTKLLKAKIINENRIDILIESMKSWYLGKIIYPGEVKSILGINYIDVYRVLEIIQELGIIDYRYEICCHECEELLNRPILDSLVEFPKELYCDRGKHKLNPFEDVIIIFKVINYAQ